MTTPPLPLSDERVVILGRTGCGKSVLLKHFIRNLGQTRKLLIFDFEGEHGKMGHKWNHRFPAWNLRTWAKTNILVYEAPRTPSADLRERADHIIEALWDVKNITFVFDEAHHWYPHTGSIGTDFPALEDLFTRGRKHKLCGIWASQMFTAMSKPLIKQATHVYVFDGLNPGEKKYLHDLKFVTDDLAEGDANRTFECVDITSGKRYQKVLL